MGNRLLAVRYGMLELIEGLEESEGPDAPGMARDEPIRWEKIHMVSSACIGYELAKARGVDLVLASAACTLHDIGRVFTGRQQGHAEAGYEYAKEFLYGLNREHCERAVEGVDGVDINGTDCPPLFTDAEIEEIAVAVSEHSDKGKVGAPLCEIVKDADVLDMHYYGRELPRPEQRVRLEKLLAELDA
ncbi:MAG: HD domain-containing protein [Clostridiales bacterium]|nr:HD domain-containing protein [Clostridiales bacterium]